MSYAAEHHFSAPEFVNTLPPAFDHDSDASLEAEQPHFFCSKFRGELDFVSGKTALLGTAAHPAASGVPESGNTTFIFVEGTAGSGPVTQ